VLLDGIAPEHAAAFVAGILAATVMAVLRGGSRSTVDRWAAAVLAYAAAVHIFLPFGHQDAVALTIALLLDGAAFGFLAWRAHVGRGWRIGTAILAPLTIVAYLSRAEDGDQVGTLTALLELTAFGLAVATSRKVGRVFGSIGVVFAVIVAGSGIWIATFKAHQAASADTQDPSIGHSHAQGHEHLARAQAGVIMRPLATAHATAQQTAAAIALANSVKKAMAKYAKLSDALAAGYRYPIGKRQGMDVHMEHPDFKKDGRYLDPERPEMLVYAIAEGKASLMGVVFVMERAGDAGVDPGGPITRWHAHNLCISLTPPGIGIVTPFGGCPASSVTITVPEMMHVWIVEPPGGPFAEGVDQEWAREYLRGHGTVL
jgi:hypothetical protein